MGGSRARGFLRCCTMTSRFVLPTIVLAALTLIVGLPIGFILLQAVFPHLADGSLRDPFEAIGRLWHDPDTRRLLTSTLTLGLGVAMVAGVMGTVLGTLRGLFRLPGGGMWDLVLLLPFLVPPYISALSWTLALQFHGYVYQLTGLNFSTWLFSREGLIAVMALNTFPIVYFAVSRSVSASAHLVSVARVCGASPAQAWRRVVLPLALPAIAGSMLLVFTAAIEEYGVPAALGAQANVYVLTTAIERRISDWPIDLSGAALLSLCLAALALAAYLLQSSLTEGRDYQTTTGKPGRAHGEPAGGLVWIIVPGFVLVAVTAVVLPVGAMLAASLSRTLGGGLHWSNLTLSNFQALVQPDSGAPQALFTSLSMALATALITVALGFVAAWCVTQKPFRGVVIVDALTILPCAMPGVVVAIGLILTWNRNFWPVTPYGTLAILVLAYCCLYLPYPVRYAQAALLQLSPSLAAAARVHGANPRRALWHIVLPLCRPALWASGLVVFAIASRELVASLILAPAGVQTVSIFVWNAFEQGSLGQGMAMASVAVFAGAVLLLIGQRLNRGV